MVSGLGHNSRATKTVDVAKKSKNYQKSARATLNRGMAIPFSILSFKGA